MRLYSELIFPYLCDFFLNRPQVAVQRQHALALASGHVLEVGFGTGLNLPHYPPAVSRITAADPNLGMHRLARRRIKASKIPVMHCALRGERIPFGDSHFDCVVSTFTLCSIAGVAQALGEMHRVLKPGGLFLFLEHGLSPEPGVRRWQRRLNWLERFVGDGCQLDRDIRGLVAGQPFTSLELEEYYLARVPRTHGFLYRGVAIK